MEEENKKSNKKNSNIRDVANFQVPKESLELFDEYCKSKGYKKTKIFTEISEYLHEKNLPLSVFLNDKYELHQMNQAIIKNHAETTSVLKKFENSFLGKIETNNTNNLDLLNKALTLILEFASKESVESVIITQIFILLRALINVDIVDKDAEILLRETLHAVETAKKILSSEKMSEPKNAVEPEKEHKKSLFIEGRVGMKPIIKTSLKPEIVYCYFTLAVKTIDLQNPISHNVFLWGGELTKKLGLLNKESKIKYYSSINVGDYFNLNGYIKETKYTNKEGVEGTNISYNVTEIIKHIPYIKKEK